MLNLAKRVNHWVWDPNEERKRLESWQQEQERLLQVLWWNGVCMHGSRNVYKKTSDKSSTGYVCPCVCVFMIVIIQILIVCLYVLTVFNKYIMSL